PVQGPAPGPDPDPAPEPDPAPDPDPDPDPDPGPDPDPDPNPDPNGQPDTDASTDPARSALVAGFGHGHRGLQGAVHVMPFPAEAVRWLHERLGSAVRARAALQQPAPDPEAQDTGGAEALGQDIAAQYDGDGLLDALPHLLGPKGMSRTVTYRGRSYQVSARVEFFGHRPAPTMSEDTDEGRRVNVEERNRTGVDTSDTLTTGNVRSLPLSYGRTWPVVDVRNPAVGSQTFTPKFTLTHNQQGVVVTIPENYTAMSALAFSSEPSHAFEYGMRWQFTAVPAPAPTAPSPHAEEHWSRPETSPGRLTAWFPHYLTQGMPPRPFGPVSPHDIPADPRTVTEELPLYRVDTVRNPSELFDTFVAADELRPHLRRMSDESAAALRTFLDENDRRTGLMLMLASAYPSPILLDRAGEPLGYLEVSARINSFSQDALARSSTRGVLETDLLHLIGAKTALTVTNAEKAEFTLTTTFQGAPSPDGNFVFGGGYKHQRTRTLNSGGTAYDWFSLVSENPHLLTDADITYTAVLVLPKGGRTEPVELHSPGGQSMRVPTMADAAGTPVPPGEERHLPPELAALRSLGVNATPLKVTGTAPLFDQLETLLRTMGFLPPSQRQRLEWLGDDNAILTAWLANSRKLTLARSQIGLRGALGSIMDGGHPLHFDLPLAHGVWRVGADLSVRPADGTSPRHVKNLPGWSVMNANGMATVGSESRGSSQSLFGDFSAEVSGPAPHDWTVAGGIPTSASATRQLTGDTSGTAASHSLDMLTYAQSGLGVFHIPGTFVMNVFSGNGDVPLATFAPEDGIVSVALPLTRTLDAPAAPLGPVTVRRATDADFRKARMTPDASGLRPQDALLLPGVAHVNVAMGSGALTGVFRKLLAGLDPQAAQDGEPGPLARILRWAAAQGSDLLTHLPSVLTALGEPARRLKDMTVGTSVTDVEGPVQEVLRAGLSATGLISRAPQIFRGGHIIDADTAGSLLGTELQGEIRGFLHNAVHEGVGHLAANPDGSTWAENDLTTTDSAWRGTTSGHSEQVSTGVTGSHSGGRPGSVSGSGGRNLAVSRGRTDTDSAFTDRISTTAHPKNPFHGFRADATYVVLLRKGHRNAVANAVGVGPHSSAAYTVTVPGGVVFWLPESLVRLDAHLSRLAGLEPSALPMDRLLPRYFARSGGRSLGLATVPDALPAGSLDDFTEAIRAAVEREAPDALTPGRGRHVRGLDARIAEAGALTGLRALAAGGSGHWRRFHFPYRGRTGLHLVEVALNARPAPGTDLASLQGVLLPLVGLENINSAAGTALTHSLSRSTGFTLTLGGTGGFTLLPGTERTGSAGASASFTGTGSRGVSRTVTRNHQEWPRTFRPAAQFQVAYQYRVEVTSSRLDESALGFLSNRIASLGELTRRLLDGALSAADTAGLTRWMDRALGRDASTTTTGTTRTPAPASPSDASGTSVVPVTVTLRFPGSEAPRRNEDGTPELPAPPPVLITPDVHRADPRPVAAPAAGVGGASPAGAERRRLSGTGRWNPAGPVTVYDFDAMEELADALRQVDPELRHEHLPKTATSAEATMRRLGDLVRRGRITLTPAQASRFTGDEPSGGSAGIKLALYRPQVETTSRQVLSQRLRTTVSTYATTGSRTVSPSVTAPLTGGLTGGNTDSLSGTVPVAGETMGAGHATGGTSFRREVLKYGTPASENSEGEPDDSGVLGFTVTAHAVLEVSGPDGTRWVTGNAVLRPTLEDVLGLGLGPARPSPGVYDIPAALAGHGLHDWRALSSKEFGDRLAGTFAEQDARVQVWLDTGEATPGTWRTLTAVRRALLDGTDPDQALNVQGAAVLPADIRLALDAAARATDRARRPVELVLRTGAGTVHLPFTPGPLHGWASEMPVPSVEVTPPAQETAVTTPQDGTVRDAAADQRAATARRLTTPQAARPVLTRRQLEGVARRLGETLPVSALTVRRCLTLVAGLRDALYPGGVRVAGTVDDAAALPGPDAAASKLVAGPGWRPVRSWDAVARAVAEAGPGAAALVLARRQGGELGHAWAAYHLGGRNGVVAVDPAAAEGRRVSATPPDLAPVEARAVVVDRAGHVLADALPEVPESSSPAHAVVDRPTGRDYGAVGLEAEERYVFAISGEVRQGMALAWGPGLSLVADTTAFWRVPDTNELFDITSRPEVPQGARQPFPAGFSIGEIVVDAMAVLPGERRQSLEEGMAELTQLRQRLSLADNYPGGVPLESLLEGLPGWEVAEGGKRARIFPHPPGYNGRVYVQPTDGVPAVGLRGLQDLAARRLTLPMTMPMLFAGKAFGRWLAQQFVVDTTGHEAPVELMPFLSAVPDVDKMWGYGWLLFGHVTATPANDLVSVARGMAGAGLVKNMLPVASRHPFDRTLLSMGRRIREFLDGHHDEITAAAAEKMTQTLTVYQNMFGERFPENFLDVVREDTPTVREHLTAALTGRTSRGRTVGQYETVGMEDYRELDTDQGRLAVPLLLEELRHYGITDQLMTHEEIRDVLYELAEFSRETYQRAVESAVPLSDEVLRRAVGRILGNIVVRELAPFLALAKDGMPSAGRRSRRPLSEYDAHNLAAALGAYALGIPLPDGLRRQLEGAVRTAIDLFPEVPREEHARVRQTVDAARRALSLLADPGHLPRRIHWNRDIPALDGRRVLVDQVSRVKHTEPEEGDPVGFSSRPARDWDGRQNTYGLLPEVKAYTTMLWSQQYRSPAGLVVPESAPLALPFHKAYLVGLSGDAASARLGLQNGAEAAVDYNAVLDYLFAADPDLIALPRKTAAVVLGADVAGPPPHDPLEHPIAGQLMANAWDRWVWTSGLGREPHILPADSHAGPRFGLAEGDWWAGFRPEPTSPQLARLARRVTGDRSRGQDVLRWVRAVRLVYGPRLEDDTAAFEALLSGFRLLDGVRAAQGDRSPLTWERLRPLVASYSPPGMPLTQALPFAMVAAAGQLGTHLELSRYTLTQSFAALRAWERGAYVPAGTALTAQGPGGLTVRGWMSGAPAPFSTPGHSTGQPWANPPAAPGPTTAYDAEAHYHAIMLQLYGQPRPAALGALRRLNALRAGVPALRGGPLDLRALARYVFSLDANAPVGPAEYTELLRLAADPATAHARRLAQLGAFHLLSRGALDAGMRFTTPNGVSGINWTDRPMNVPIDVNTAHLAIRRPDGTVSLQAPIPAGWSGGPTPYTLVADGTLETVTVRGRNGFVAEARREIVSELLPMDPVLRQLPSGVPLLMLVSLAAAGDTLLSRGTAVGLGREVWSTSGFVLFGFLPDQPGRLGIGVDVTEGQGIIGGWLLSDPTLPPAPLPGGAEWEQRVVSLPVIGRDHRSTGHLSVSLAEDPAQLRSRTLLALQAASMTHFAHYDSATHSISRPVPLPWLRDHPGATPYFEIKHGGPGATYWELRGGTAVTSGPWSTGALGRRPSLRAKRDADPLVKIICFGAQQNGEGYHGGSGPPPYVPDPLAVSAEAQWNANGTGGRRPVTYAARRRVRYFSDTDGPVVLVYNDIRGGEFGLERIVAEPEGTALDDLARTAGLHSGPGPAPGHVRERTLRLVRLLRYLFGTRIEQDTAYPVLLHGAGALDRMLRNDPELRRMPLFTVSLFTWVARADHARHAPPDRKLDRAAMREVLVRAAQRIAQAPGTTLSAYVPLPALADTVSAVMRRPDVDALTAWTLGLPGNAPIGDAERSRMLWAHIKTDDMLRRLHDTGGEQEIDRYAARVLHLAAPDPAHRATLRHYALLAFAGGRENPGVVRELAEIHLEKNGARAATTLLTDRNGGSVLGRDVTGRPAGALDIDLTVLTLLRRAPDGTLVVHSTVPAPWHADDPQTRPWLFRADRHDDTRVEVRGIPAPHEDIAELVYREPTLAVLPERHPVVLMVPRSRPRPGEPLKHSLPGLGAALAAHIGWPASAAPRPGRECFNGSPGRGRERGTMRTTGWRSGRTASVGSRYTSSAMSSWGAG
ncbi:lonely Cys domain-containing protein, partial [Streptomyces albus]|uniref:lonely Cys domain-containing protein n=1 Tax=Streptomyces albus TaxID=1888 RepID=UPI0010BE8415